MISSRKEVVLRWWWKKANHEFSHISLVCMNNVKECFHMFPNDSFPRKKKASYKRKASLEFKLKKGTEHTHTWHFFIVCPQCEHRFIWACIEAVDKTILCTRLKNKKKKKKPTRKAHSLWRTDKINRMRYAKSFAQWPHTSWSHSCSAGF